MQLIFCPAACREAFGFHREGRKLDRATIKFHPRRISPNDQSVQNQHLKTNYWTFCAW